ncbi:MAG: substrate-binding domain-containing protein, partial [Lachnospiraceae bacterium]|nr:substrate-binding domain-containing protein [Lachnospiraceae bacterium]
TELDLSAKKWLDTFDVPVVLLDISLPGIGYDCVAINNFQAAYDAVDYLFACGHKTIGYFRSGIRISNFNEREHGYWSCLHRHGVDILPAQHIHTVGDDYDSFLKHLTESGELADAYLVDNDHLAAALLKAFHDNGYHLPNEVSIIGIDDMPLSDMIVPSLTTMRVDRQSLATTAVDRLLRRISDPKIPPVRILVDTELVVRDSVRIRKETKN